MEKINGIPYNEYHKMYYNEKIKGCKVLCECGLMVDKFRFARHRRSNKHIKQLSILNENSETKKFNIE